jgi:hypothetical protein
LGFALAMFRCLKARSEKANKPDRLGQWQKEFTMAYSTSRARDSNLAHRPADLLRQEPTEEHLGAGHAIANRSATWAEWDEELLAGELQDLRATDFDLSLTGFDTKEIDDILLDDPQEEDAVEEAARAAGIGTQTLYRWMKEPEFDEAYRVIQARSKDRAEVTGGETGLLARSYQQIGSGKNTKLMVECGVDASA